MAKISGIPSKTQAYNSVFEILHESYGKDIFDLNHRLGILSKQNMFRYQGKTYPYGSFAFTPKGEPIEITTEMVEIIEELELLEIDRVKAISMFKRWYNACPYYELFVETLPPKEIDSTKIPENVLEDYHKFIDNPLYVEVTGRIIAAELLK